MLFLLFTGLLSNVVSQNNTCNCLENLSLTIKKTEENYAGFPDKVTARTRPAYQAMVTNLQKKAAKETDPKRCFSLISTYVTFFKDRHFDVALSLHNESDKVFSKLTESDYRKSLEKNPARGIDGIWTNPDSSVSIAVQNKGKDAYQAVVIKSTVKETPVGLVYANLTKTPEGYSFSKHNFMTAAYPARLHGGLLRLWNIELWGKVFPGQMTLEEKMELATWRNYNFGLQFKMLDQRTAYLKIPTFSRDNLVQKLIVESDATIRKAAYLIVDLRGNGGGNTGWSYLLPYFMTRPIDQGENYLRLSADNIKRNLDEMEPVVKNPVSDEMKKYFTPAYMLTLIRAYEEIPVSKEVYYPIPSITIPLDSVAKFPKKIALIFDDLCGSSAEYFFHISRQSDKITRYGDRTFGMMDYLGMPQRTALPFKDYHLVIPDTKSSWTDKAPIDQTGFIPEVDLSVLPQWKWVDFVKNDLSKHK